MHISVCTHVWDALVITWKEKSEPTVLNPRMVWSMCITLWQNKYHTAPKNITNFGALFMHTKLVATFAVITALLSKGRELNLTEYWIKTSH